MQRSKLQARIVREHEAAVVAPVRDELLLARFGVDVGMLVIAFAQGRDAAARWLRLQHAR